MPAGVIRNSGQAILGELRAADADLANGMVNPTQLARPTAPDNGQLKRLGALVQTIAGELGLAPEILATRNDMTAMLRGSRDVRPLRGWRRAVVGESLLAAV
jgi:ribonuclease D